MKTQQLNPTIYFVNAVDSPEFANLTRALTSSSVIGLDAEWKPQHTHQSTFPTVSLFQIACQLGVGDGSTQPQNDESLVFLLDLSSIPLTCVYNLLKDMFVSPDVLKLGFRFKQDLVYLSSTFCSQGCTPGFDRVEPYLDITTIYNCLRHKQLGKKLPKESKSLAAICKELLGISISKELQCSDWSCRPLTDEQKIYAAIDAQCLVEIFNAFQTKIVGEGTSCYDATEHQSSKMDHGLKHILVNHISSNKVSRTQYVEALVILRASTSVLPQSVEVGGQVNSRMCNRSTIPMDANLLQIVRKYADKILLKESDRKPKTSRKKVKIAVSKRSMFKENQLVNADVYEGPPPWDLSLSGDGSPKFLCDVMVEGLAKHLRCVGIDAAIPDSKRPETRELIDQAYREKRVLLTRDAKLLRHEYLIKNQMYRVKSLLKNEQLLEVIETFQLTISEDQLMTRCTKCNGRFIQKPLTTEEAVEAAKGFQVIPNCLFNQNIEFWQCMDCKQLYWEGTQYHNAVQKFIDVCKLKE